MHRSMLPRMLFVSMTLICAFLIGACSEQPKPEAKADTSKADEEIIRKMSYEWIEAYNKKDTKWFDTVMADNYTMVHARGTIHNKQQEIAEAVADTSKTELDRLQDVKVSVYGDAAIVTSIEHLQGQAGEVKFDLQYFYTDVYIRQDGKWRVVTTQSTRLPDGSTE